MIYGPTAVILAVSAGLLYFLSLSSPGAINGAIGLGLGAGLCALAWFAEER